MPGCGALRLLTLIEPLSVAGRFAFNISWRYSNRETMALDQPIGDCISSTMALPGMVNRSVVFKIEADLGERQLDLVAVPFCAITTATIADEFEEICATDYVEDSAVTQLDVAEKELMQTGDGGRERREWCEWQRGGSGLVVLSSSM